LGFTFDISPVKTEAAAIANVINEYRRAVTCGEVDPDVYIPRFNAALKSAGLDMFIAEKQRQLDTWLAKNSH
jgi:putative aldouronate transport system substrate-binding protein